MDKLETDSQNKIEEIRAQHRLETNERRKQKIHDLLTIKRKWTSDESETVVEITQERVAEFSKQLKKHKKLEILKYLSEAFSHGEKYINTFLSVDGALYSLIGCLIGKDVNLKLASVVCLINLGTGSHKSTSSCIKTAAVYLLVYLGNGSYELQELCVWALGNFAADCEKCSEILNKQGFVPAVKKLLNSPNEKVQYSAYFALACYTHTRRNNTDGKNDLNLMSVEIMDIILRQLSNCLQTQPDTITVITPLVRALANLCSGEENIIHHCVSKPEIGLVLSSLLQSRYSHVIKESLWLIANIVGCNEGVSILQYPGLLQRVADLSENIGAISLQSLVCLCNMAISKQFSKVLVCEMSIFTKVSRLLQRPDVETIKGCLTLLALLLENGDLPKDEVISLSKFCLVAIEVLKGHEDVDIRNLCNVLIEKLN
uniref:Importin subunit alpha n=1 Tax=Strigamia maritima TaxID=126957 RepID=T1IXF4_STRMM